MAAHIGLRPWRGGPSGALEMARLDEAHARRPALEDRRRSRQGLAQWLQTKQGAAAAGLGEDAGGGELAGTQREVEDGGPAPDLDGREAGRGHPTRAGRSRGGEQGAGGREQSEVVARSWAWGSSDRPDPGRGTRGMDGSGEAGHPWRKRSSSCENDERGRLHGEAGVNEKNQGKKGRAATGPGFGRRRWQGSPEQTRVARSSDCCGDDEEELLFLWSSWTRGLQDEAWHGCCCRQRS